MTVRYLGSLMISLVAMTFTGAASAKDWSGFSVRGGYALGSGDFTISHQHETFSLGTLLTVPTKGNLTMVGAIYRWSPFERVYLGAKVDLYHGDLTGERSHDYHGLRSTLDFRTTLTGTIGGQLGYAFGAREQLLGYIGGGVAGSKAQMSAAVTYQDHGVAENWEGGALGPYVEVGASYAFTDTVSGFVEVKQFFYEASESCTIERYGCGRITASTKPLVLTLGVEITF